jgi:D-glycero-alpha-D-manno-heptose-7-phosphate kinase
MIVSRTPLRISFAGGGSDLPGFYMQEQGAVLSTSIDKYIYLAIHRFFEPDKIQLKYSRTELVNDVSEINHPIFRECLSMFHLRGVDINSIADVPAGTGLGSSSSFTVGLVHLLNAYRQCYVSQEYLASTACTIEMDRLKEPIGKQDQYAAAYGGLNFIRFNGDGSVEVEKIIMQSNVKKQLEKNLLMIYTGEIRSASAILQNQSEAIRQSAKKQIQRTMVQQAFELKELLQNNRIDDFGRLLHEGWMLKKTLSTDISNPDIDTLYRKGIDAGALGGKLLGAGGGGFILFYCPEERQPLFRKAMSVYRELQFNFDNHGSKIIYITE